MSKLYLHLFGSPRMAVDDSPVEVDTRKATALMGFLAVTGKIHQRDTLAALLWPDYDQTSARAALRRTLSTLNRGLGGEQENRFLETSRDTIGLSDQADLWLDVAEFHRLTAAAAAHNHPADEFCTTCIDWLQAAADLYREPFMAGFNLRDSPNFEEWQFFQEETLRRELGSALEKLVKGLEASGRIDEAVQYARRWLALDPLMEEAHRQLMALYARTDQRNAALRQYRECVRILDQELGVAPLEETTRVYQAILNRTELPETENKPRLVGGVPTPQSAPTAEAALAPERAPQTRPLVGREKTLRQMQQLYQFATADGKLIALEGEAGIGKTRLAEAFIDQARSGGARIIQARCYSGETGLAYAPFIVGLSAALALPGSAERLKTLAPGTLAEAGRLLPELRELAGPSAPVSLTPRDGAQTRFYEALRQVLNVLLRGDVPGVLFLDDLQWADAATLDLLAYLARRLNGMSMLLLTAWRTEQTDSVQALKHLSAELGRSGTALRLELSRFNPAQIAELVTAYTGEEQSERQALVRRLYEESEGLPFVAVEYLSALAGQPSSQDWQLPASVRDLLHSRLDGLEPAARQLLSAAAVLGRSFDFETLREASGRSEMESIDGLDQLLSAGLVKETGGQSFAYDFTHEKLRALIYEETSLARRRLLHRRAAEALARTQGGRYEQAGLAAYHYEQAGHSELAAEYHQLAGERARLLFANVEAMAHYQAALASGHPDAAGLHESIGDLHILRGDYDAALGSYQTAAALCTPGCLSNLEHKLGNVHQRKGEWELAESHYLASLEAAGEPGQNPTPFHVYLFADRAMVAFSLGKIKQAQALAEQSLDFARACGEPHALAQAHNALGVLARARGDLSAAAAALEDSLRSAELLDDPQARIAALNNLALVYGEAGDVQQAIRVASQALELCRRRGDRHRQAALHNNLADLLHRAGREEEAMEQLKQAVVIFADIGVPVQQLENKPPAAAAEIWKLTEW